MYIYVHMLIHSVCMCVYIYILCSDCFCFRHILLLMTYLLALLLTHVFRQFLWHIHRPCTANGSPHLPYGRGRWHGAMRGDDQDGWNKIWRPSHIVTIDMSEKVSFLAMARWNHPMKFPSERRPRIETSAHAGWPLAPLHLPSARLPLERNGHRGVHHRWGAQPLNQRFLNVKWLILPTLVVIIHN